MKKTTGLLLCVVATAISAATIKDAIQQSMVTNPDLLFNTSKKLTDKQRIDVARGAYFPSVDLRAGYGRESSRNPTTTAISGPGTRILNRSEAEVQLTQNLFAGGAIENELKRNKYFYEAQAYRTQGVAEDLALDVIDRYLQVLVNERLYALAMRNYEEHQHIYSLIKERRDAGLAKEAEIYQANSRLALAESNKIAAFANLREMKIRYTKVVGGWPKRLKWPKPPKAAELPENINKAIEYGLEHHPTVTSSYADIKEAKSQYLVARAAYYPKIDGILSASNNRNLAGLIGPNDNKLAIVRMNWNVFRGGSDVAEVKRTAYQVQEAFEVKNQALIDLKESLRLSWNAWIASGERINPLRRHVENAKKTRAAYAEQFKLGKRTLLDLLDSQTEYYNAQINYVNGKNDELFSRFRLLNGTGRLLFYFDIRLADNVFNNDIYRSDQRQLLTDLPMDQVPYPARFEGDVALDGEVDDIERITPSQKNIDRNSTHVYPYAPKDWYVSAGYFKNEANARALYNKLKGLGFTVLQQNFNKGWYVLVGPFEYRGHASNTMTRLKEVAKLEGVLITFQDDDLPQETSSK